jgi:hypothetical protein
MSPLCCARYLKNARRWTGPRELEGCCRAWLLARAAGLGGWGLAGVPPWDLDWRLRKRPVITAEPSVLAPLAPWRLTPGCTGATLAYHWPCTGPHWATLAPPGLPALAPRTALAPLALLAHALAAPWPPWRLILAPAQRHNLIIAFSSYNLAPALAPALSPALAPAGPFLSACSGPVAPPAWPLP